MCAAKKSKKLGRPTIIKGEPDTVTVRFGTKDQLSGLLKRLHAQALKDNPRATRTDVARKCMLMGALALLGEL